MLIHTYLPQLKTFTIAIAPLAKSGLTVTLFLIGAGLSRKVLKNVGWQPLLQGIVIVGSRLNSNVAHGSESRLKKAQYYIQ